MNRDRVSKDIQVDAEAAKVLCENLCLYADTGKLIGYVQEINQNPFGLLLISDIQVQPFYQIISELETNSFL